MGSILHEPVGGSQRHVCRFFRAKNRKSDLPVSNINQNLAKKLNPTLTSSILKAMTHLAHVHAVCEK